MSSRSLIEIFLQFPSQVKLYHWQTTSYPRHKASDSLVSGIQELIDQFVETYQGKYQRIYLKNNSRGSAPTDQSDTTIPIYDLNDRNIVAYLEEFKTFLQNDIFQIIKETDTDLINIRDEMLSLINQTLYLFTLA
jgi:hypothetical protein